jgi:hypothetical protein
VTTCWPTSTVSDNYADARQPFQPQKPTSAATSGHGIGIATRSAQFVYGLLGLDYDNSPYTQAGERVSRLAMSGIRLVIDEFRADVTKTRKDGSKGALRIDYGDAHQPEAPVKWLWKFVDGAKTAGELYGRALVVIAAEQYASRLVVPQSQRSHPNNWASHKDNAAKALKKLAGPHLPGSLRQLETAVKRAHEDCARAERAAVEGHRAGSVGDAEGQESGDPAEDVTTAEADVEYLDDEGPAEA